MNVVRRRKYEGSAAGIDEKASVGACDKFPAQKGLDLGGHKAAAIALILKRADITLVSEMDEELVRSIFLEPEKSVQRAFDKALLKHGPQATVIVMPYGGSTLPKLIG